MPALAMRTPLQWSIHLSSSRKVFSSTIACNLCTFSHLARHALSSLSVQFCGQPQGNAVIMTGWAYSGNELVPIRWGLNDEAQEKERVRDQDQRSYKTCNDKGLLMYLNTSLKGSQKFHNSTTHGKNKACDLNPPSSTTMSCISIAVAS